MSILVLLIIALFLFLFAYKIYAKFIAQVFEENNNQKTPAVELKDDVDYVPSKALVVFSHHFASIAGAGPIVGPTLALVFGYIPVFLWVIIGSIFVGAVHDFVTLFASVREKGKSIAEVVEKSLGKTAFLLIITFTILSLILVTAVFLKLTAASLTSLVPLAGLKLEPTQKILKTVVDAKDGILKAQIGGIASTSVLIITLLAPLMGFLLYKKNANPYIMGFIAFIICIVAVLVGIKFPVSINPDNWMYVLAGYTFLAAGIPVWIILQPRDFTNSFFLYLGIFILIIGGLFIGLKGATLQMPAFNIADGSAKVGFIWPFLFITVACGACSGFHALVSGGTSAKQIEKESDVKIIGYGAMLLEALLAVGVIIAIAFAVKFSDYLNIVFPVDKTKLSNPALAFSLGLGGMLHTAFNLPIYVGTVFGILLLEGFLVTTLDTAVRLNRYLFEELWNQIFKNPPLILKKYFFNSAICVVLMLALAKTNSVLDIWKIFGSANQLLAALSLLGVTIWLKLKGKNYLFTLLPAIFMSITTIASLLFLLFKYFPAANYTLIFADIILLLLAFGVIIISLKAVLKKQCLP